MDEKECVACRRVLVLPSTPYEERVYHRICCESYIHHSCMREYDLGQCQQCLSRSEQPLRWEPVLPPAVRSLPPPSQSNVIVLGSDDEDDDNDDDEMNQPPRKKLKTNEQEQKEKECCICYDKETIQDKILTTFCCRHSAHLSCLRKHYELPPECLTLKHRKRVAVRLGTPGCFVCRSQPNKVVGLDARMVHELLPRVSMMEYLWGAQEANQAMNRWLAMFDRILDKLTEPWKDMMRIDEAITWVMRENGTREKTQFRCIGKYSSHRTFQSQLKDDMREVIRKWAGLAPTAMFFNEHTSQDFRLHEIVEVGLIFRLTNLYLEVQRPKGPDVPPFTTEKVMVPLSTWKCCGHFFDFDEVTFGDDEVDRRMVTSKVSVWRHERIA